MAASILRAVSFGIPVPDWGKNPKMLTDVVDSIVISDFEPKKDAKIITDETATSLTAASIDDADVIDDLIAKLEESAKSFPPGFRMNPIQFEKVCSAPHIFSTSS